VTRSAVPLINSIFSYSLYEITTESGNCEYGKSLKRLAYKRAIVNANYDAENIAIYQNIAIPYIKKSISF